jgi:hypothetical protein
LKRALKGWSPSSYSSAGLAEEALNAILWKIVEVRVKKRAPTKPRALPWWDGRCKRALKRKLQTFKTRVEFPARYKNAVRRCKRVQRKAFAVYNVKLRKQLNEMQKSD